MDVFESDEPDTRHANDDDGDEDVWVDDDDAVDEDEATADRGGRDILQVGDLLLNPYDRVVSGERAAAGSDGGRSRGRGGDHLALHQRSGDG